MIFLFNDHNKGSYDWFNVFTNVKKLKEVTAYIYSKFDFLPGTNQKNQKPHKPTCTVTGLIINFNLPSVDFDSKFTGVMTGVHTCFLVVKRFRNYSYGFVD